MARVFLPGVRRGVYERARLVTGGRGVVRIVFLARLADDAAAPGDWAVRVRARRDDAVVSGCW